MSPFVIVLLWSGVFGADNAQPFPSGHVLSLEEAISIAYAHQPTLEQAHALTEVMRARSAQVFSGYQSHRATPGSGFLPLVSFIGIYNRHTLNQSPGIIPGDVVDKPVSEPTPFKMYNFGTGTLSVTQLIFSTGQQPNRWRSAVTAAEAQAESELATRLQVLLNVRTAYFAARAERDLVRVARETMENQQRHLRQAEGLVKVGNQPEIALAQSRTDVANARLQLINTENNYETGKAQLNNAMGIEARTDYDVQEETLPPVPGETAEVEALMDEALAARPEFKAISGQIHSQELLMSSYRGMYGPTLSLNVTLTDRGPMGPVPNGVQLQWFDSHTYYPGQFAWNATAQLVLNWPIFNGFLVPSLIHEQEALIDGLHAQAEALRQQVRLSIDQARLAVRAATQAIATADEALTNARVQLKLAEARYAAGIGNIIELGDAQVTETSAAAQRVQADFNLAAARALLLQALGRP